MAVNQPGLGAPEGRMAGMTVEERDEDDHHPGDEGRFDRGGERQADGLELVTAGEQQAGDDACEELSAGDGAELAAVDEHEGGGSDHHADEVHQQRGGVGECGFDEDEGGSPDHGGEEEKQVGEG